MGIIFYHNYFIFAIKFRKPSPRHALHFREIYIVMPYINSFFTYIAQEKLSFALYSYPKLKPHILPPINMVSRFHIRSPAVDTAHSPDSPVNTQYCPSGQRKFLLVGCILQFQRRIGQTGKRQAA